MSISITTSATAVRVVVSIEPEAPVIDRAALAAERERLVARLAEIDGLLA